MAEEKLVEPSTVNQGIPHNSVPFVLVSRSFAVGDRETVEKIRVALTSAGARVLTAEDFLERGRQKRCALPPGEILGATGEDPSADVVLLLVGSKTERSLRELFPDALCVGLFDGGADVDVRIDNVEIGDCLSVYEHVVRRWTREKQLLQYARAQRDTIGLQKRQIQQLADVGIALSAERVPGRLLNRILLEARSLANCEAGSLYLLSSNEEADERELVFKLAHNDLISIPFKEKRIPLSTSSLAGYVAITGNELVIDDAYTIDAEKPYSFNPRFDIENGYRTRSLLVIPMRNHKDRVVGVLQFINRCDDNGDPANFDSETVELLRALSSQAAIAIEKNSLIRNINELFESFVQASVKAIEQRDPSTSGHSFRVAETTTALLTALPLSGLKRFKQIEVTPENLKEVRYAALLHDFGKVGVRENILTKARKLTDEQLELYRYRVELQKERLRNRALKQEVEELHRRPEDFAAIRQRVRHSLNRAISVLDDYFSAIEEANNPTIKFSGSFEHLQKIGEYDFFELDGRPGKLLKKSDLVALSVTRGSLTEEERRQIEDHVVHTRDFLSVLPWPQELAKVPAIAAAHHEKLNGSGYPLGLIGEEIPLPSRVMTVCDIYDALTAMDRPYKSSVSVEMALGILQEEVAEGMLDADIVDVFIASRIYGVVDSNYKGPMKKKP